jgi:hypothetical protein
MIVAIGLRVDDTLMRVIECAVASGVEVCVVDLSEAVSGKWRFERPSQGTSELRYGGETLKLNPCDSLLLPNCGFVPGDAIFQSGDPVACIHRRTAILAKPCPGTCRESV